MPVLPRPVQRPHPPVWMGSGLHNESCDMAIARGMPLILPSLFRYPQDYRPILERYREGMDRAGKADRIRVALPSHCWVGRTSQEAHARYQPYLENYVAFARALREGFGRPMDFAGLIGGPAICGSPAQVVDRIGELNELLGLDLHLLKMDAGGVPYPELADGLERMGAAVLPHFHPSQATASAAS